MFIVDDAAQYAEELDACWQIIRDEKLPAFILLGERLNEWRQRRPRLHPVEYELGPLSDGEINRLLACLGATNQLGTLEHLTPELRYAAIAEKHQKELLVTLREATEGRAFDAIIESEFNSISDVNARSLYGFICSFSRLKKLPRQYLLLDALKMDAGKLARILHGAGVDHVRGVGDVVVSDSG